LFASLVAAKRRKIFFKVSQELNKNRKVGNAVQRSTFDDEFIFKHHGEFPFFLIVESLFMIHEKLICGVTFVRVWFASNSLRILMRFLRNVRCRLPGQT
jgi:hypothetical protein